MVQTINCCCWWSRIHIYFRQNDSSNTGYPLRLSTTPDGIWNGGVEYTGSNWNSGNYAPGSNSHQSNYSFQGPPTHTNYTPPILYPYCPNQPGMYRTQSSPVRYGSFSYRLNAGIRYYFKEK
ncbi:MAG: hypothetical protein CM15mV4_1140 [Caudoviricetes sp.]|nr:MAG: hypothetical protein CM15mV4_1140 [Caudoviricetes sp.]